MLLVIISLSHVHLNLLPLLYSPLLGIPLRQCLNYYIKFVLNLQVIFSTLSTFSFHFSPNYNSNTISLLHQFPGIQFESHHLHITPSSLVHTNLNSSCHYICYSQCLFSLSRHAICLFLICSSTSHFLSHNRSLCGTIPRPLTTPHGGFMLLMWGVRALLESESCNP